MMQASVGTAHADDSERETGFELTNVAAHLESAADVLSSVAVAREACVAKSNQVRELAAKIRTSSRESVNLETLESSLSLLEKDLFSILIAAAPEDLKALWKKRAACELVPYRDRINTNQMQQLERQFVQKQLLAHYRLPRISLFYIGQQ